MTGSPWKEAVAKLTAQQRESATARALTAAHEAELAELEAIHAARINARDTRIQTIRGECRTYRQNTEAMNRKLVEQLARAKADLRDEIEENRAFRIPKVRREVWGDEIGYQFKNPNELRNRWSLAALEQIVLDLRTAGAEDTTHIQIDNTWIEASAPNQITPTPLNKIGEPDGMTGWRSPLAATGLGMLAAALGAFLAALIFG